MGFEVVVIVVVVVVVPPKSSFDLLFAAVIKLSGTFIAKPPA